MSSIRLYVSKPLPPSGEIIIADGAFHHLCRVLRAKPGQTVTLFNGDGFDYVGTLTAVSKREACIRIDHHTKNVASPTLSITLLQAVSKGERMDWAVQKSVELGVSRIVPVLTERSVVRLTAERWEKKVNHWQQVAISACEQSGRSDIPIIAPVQTLSQAWQALPTESLRLVASPDGQRKLRDLNDTQVVQGVVILVGPEGGLTDTELNALTPQPIKISMGPRILRTETAPLAFLAGLHALYGDS
ncbi:MAG: 16S rRNA (uracil(1498)-N(3))-methyltransferase [Gammaproteobacteria bacterium]|nr:MAG: 16S rRNA (uracil(1498)-N(3))-methyltransferase [Gammaproteobacteria bacterium]